MKHLLTLTTLYLAVNVSECVAIIQITISPCAPYLRTNVRHDYELRPSMLDDELSGFQFAEIMFT